MLFLRRRQLLQSLVASAGLSAVPGLGCSASPEELEEESLDAIEARAQALLNVKKIVIVMMENRSFDHYFGHLTIPTAQGGEGKDRYVYRGGKPEQREGDRRVNGLTGTEWNPKTPNGREADGVKVFYAHDKNLGFAIGDINHEWVECHAQWNPKRVGQGQLPTEGGMNGFIVEHLRDRGELTPRDLGPAWGATCDTFPTICEQGTPTGGTLICGYEKKSGTPEEQLGACGHPDAPMAYYKRADTPVYHAFYDEFVLCDNWYASVCGPTWPNRFYVHSATAASSFGTDPKRDARRNIDSIFKVLKASNVPFYNFFGDAPLVTAMYGNDASAWFDGTRGMAKVFEGASPTDRLFQEAAKAMKGTLVTGGLSAATSVARDDSFEKRCKLGTLPPISYVEPPYFCGDDHAPHDIQMGQAFIKSLYTMLYGPTANPEQAKSTLFIVVYDEHGSFYDHQDPGLAFKQSAGDKDSDFNFKPLGFRVPAMIVGPMVKKKHVSHTIYDHTSVVRTIYNWVQVHTDNRSGVLEGIKAAAPEAAGAQTRQMIEEVYAAGYSKSNPLRPLHATNYDGKIHKPMLRVLAANDIADCLNPAYDPSQYAMPAMPTVTTREGRVLASLQYSHGQEGIAKAHGLRQPSVYGKTEAAKVVMEHMYRLGAVDIG